LRYSVELH